MTDFRGMVQVLADAESAARATVGTNVVHLRTGQQGVIVGASLNEVVIAYEEYRNVEHRAPWSDVGKDWRVDPDQAAEVRR